MDSYLKLPDIINKTEVKVKPIATLKKPIELRLKLQEKYSDLKKAYQIYLTMIKP